MNYHKVTFERSFGLLEQMDPSDLPEIVFAGRSNVGKSSMINKVFNQKQLARVSSMPGKTITINFFHAEGVRFVDLPGYGYAKRSWEEQERWSQLIEGYFGSDRDIRLVLSLVDIRHPPMPDDIKMINYLIDRELPFVVILTKLDKLNKAQRAARLEAIPQELPCGDQITLIPFSSQTGEGVQAVQAIFDEIAQEE